jgi:hypothetical protein
MTFFTGAGDSCMVQQTTIPGTTGDTTTSRFRQLISQQNAIGWRQLFHSRFSREWARLHDDYQFTLQQQHDHNSAYFKGTIKRTGDQWCTDITTVLWSRWTELWKLRNDVVHGRDAQERQQQRTQEKENLRKLRHIYSTREFMEPSIQELLFDKVTEHEKLPSQSIHNWLAVHEDIFNQSIKKAAHQAMQGVRNIKSYFTTKSIAGQVAGSNRGHREGSRAEASAAVQRSNTPLISHGLTIHSLLHIPQDVCRTVPVDCFLTA